MLVVSSAALTIKSLLVVPVTNGNLKSMISTGEKTDSTHDHPNCNLI